MLHSCCSVCLLLFDQLTIAKQCLRALGAPHLHLRQIRCVRLSAAVASPFSSPLRRIYRRSSRRRACCGAAQKRQRVRGKDRAANARPSHRPLKVCLLRQCYCCGVYLFAHSSVESSKKWASAVRGEDVDELLKELQCMHVGAGAAEASPEQQSRVARSVKDLSDHALRVGRRIQEIGGVIKPVNVDLVTLIASGCSASEVIGAGFTAGDVKAQKQSVKQMRDKGWTLPHLIEAGFDASALVAGDFSAAELRCAGVTAAQLKAAGCSAHLLKGAGFTSFQLRAAGFDLGSLIIAGFELSALKKAGFVGL
jgi:hypothetical protein